MLLIYIIFCVFFVGIVYHKRVSRSFNKILHWKSVATWLLILTLSPIIVSWFLFPSKHSFTDQEKYEIGVKLNHKTFYWQGLDGLVKQQPGDFELQVKYINEFIRINQKGNRQNYCWTLIHEFQKNQNTYLHNPAVFFNNILIEQYTRAHCKGDLIQIDRINQIDTVVPFLDYIKAYYHFQLGDVNKARNHILKEMQVTSESPTTNALLYYITQSTGTADLRTLIENPEIQPSIPAYIKRDYYFEQGEIGSYWLNAFVSTLKDTHVIAFLAALLISVVWVFFMRSMDIYDREKWSDIILVFILGSASSFFALYTYDVFHHVLRFNLNGELLNDFMYSVIAIGANEELVKFAPWFIFGLAFNKLKEPFDYVLYASIAALGFAFIENLHYLENYNNIVIRSIMSTVGHMFDATLIAFGFIIARYRVSTLHWKVFSIAGGFLGAFISHGFYDFWLISDAAGNNSVFTVIYFFLTVHIWFVIKNSALNNSPKFSNNFQFNSLFQQDLLTLFFVVVMMTEYLLTASLVGYDYAFIIFFKSAVIIMLFLILVNLELTNFSLARGVWRKISPKVFQLHWATSLGNIFMNWGYQQESPQQQVNFTGYLLRLFVPKSNPYIGDQLPISGQIERRLDVGQDPNFYLFRYNRPIQYGSFVSSHCIIRVKKEQEDFSMDKIEIIYLIIPSMDILHNDNIRVEDFRYIGKAYARPIID
jgi:RsiW-degrading membrane proteinase PrsW (M82 family)